MRHQLGKDFEPITIKIHREQKAALVRRSLEHGRGVTYADLVRKAIAAFLEPKPTIVAGGMPASNRALVDAEARTAFVHFHTGDRRSACGLVGLEASQLERIHDSRITCQRCRAIVFANADAIAKRDAPAKRNAPAKRSRQTELPHTRAPKKAAKKAGKR